MQKKENIVTLYDKLTEAGFADKFKISITDSHEFYGYTYLKIYSQHIRTKF